MTAIESPPIDRVIWIGTGPKSRGGRLRRFFKSEPEQDWGELLAEEMNAACDEMPSQRLRLTSIVPVESSVQLQGGWTEGAWLHFARTE